MAVVLEQIIGNTVVRIHDDACRDKTPEEVRSMLQRVALLVQAERYAAAEKESDKPD